MSSSIYTVHPAALLDSSKDRMHEPRNVGPQDNQTQHIPPATPGDSNHLSPFSSSQAQSNSTSPLLNNTNTPAGSLSALSEQYQSSDFASEVDDDPFFGVDFNNDGGGTPSFLDDQILSLNLSSDSIDAFSIQSAPNQSYDVSDSLTYPLSPDQTPSIDTTSPRSDRKESRSRFPGPPPESISPKELSKPVKQSSGSVTSDEPAPQLTPKTSTSGPSSEDGIHAAATMPCPSPRVTVSMWGKDAPVHNIDSAFPPEADSPTTVRAGFSADDGFIPASYQNISGASANRDELGNWEPNSRTGQRGLDPTNRPTTEVPSANELDSRRKVDEKNQEVNQWISASQTSGPPDAQPAAPLAEEHDGIPDREIPTGHLTENKPISGQLYYTETGGELTAEDIQMMRQNRNWENAPVLFGISQQDSHRYQPQTSQAAIERFERMCRDNDSIVSRAATWGTRRRSLPSIYDTEGVTSGNFLKKLSISRDSRRPSILKELRGLVRKPSASQLLKRSRNSQDEEPSSDPDAGNRRESQSSLAPPGRQSSWGKKQSMPSLNTALVNMGAGVASIGTTHARSGSISNATPVTSPKSPFNLQVKNTLRRPRSKSDLPKGANDNSGSHSNLIEMMKKIGGPPVAQLSKGAPAPADDDDEDDDDLDEDADLKGESTKMIEDITPNFAGFQQHILKLNPILEHQNNFLVDRIAHQQIVRYKSLLNSKVKHLQHVTHRSCPCGAMCIALGGSATVLDIKGDPRGLDPLSTRYDGSDGDLTPLEGAINSDSFPQDIPMPPTNTLPAEFECQLCYQAKKFQKPSDWTKHVHEDVQPFTCTWDRCRDPKIFKRKADWVRHENEGHRHLEWWTCDVDDCRHTCYRRDNFLQHLVREHKFPEPKVKTKAAIKRAGGIDPTWQKVEKCHEETKARPQDEPCRFCGKTFPTWKKLTVHLAKHMEQISLPILRLVARKDLEADTIISPVQEPPPRNFAPIPVKREHQPFNTPNLNQLPVQQHPGGLAYPGTQQNPYGYQAMPQGHFQQQYFHPQFDGLPHSLDAMTLGVQQQVHPGFSNQPAYNTMPVTTGSFVTNPQQYIPVHQNVEPFPAMQMNALGLQDPTANQMPYDSMMDPSSAGGDQFTPHGSVSPYSHSPHQGQGGFYGHQ